MAKGQGTKSLHETAPPKSAGEQQRKVPLRKIVSSCGRNFGLTKALQRLGNLCRVNSQVDTVDVARPRQVHSKLFPNATGTRGKNNHPIAETSCLADVMRNEHDCLVSGLPDSLKIAVELLASKRIKSSKRFVHEQHTRIRRQRASK